MTAREAEAARLLGELGLPGARLRVCGQEGEMVAVSVPEPQWARLVLGEEGRALSARLRALGYRYVTVDLEPPPAEG